MSVPNLASIGNVCATMLSCIVLACVPAMPEAEARRAALEGGRALAPCDWPSVGAIEVNCTATLIGPHWILSAAHCPDGPRFRLWTGSAYLEAPIGRCVRHPDYDAAAPVGSPMRVFDVMLCELDSPIDVPVVPLLSGCEAAELESPPHRLPLGTPVVVVGLGLPSFGSKRATGMEPASFVLRRPLVPFSDPTRSGGARPGDSGGPTFLQMRDGTWRQIGVHQGGVDWSVTDVFVADAMDWIESTSGLDATPCHAGGAWTPSAACVDLPSNLEGLGGAFPACTIERRAPSPTCVGTVDAGPTPSDGGAAADAGGSTLDAGSVPDAAAIGDAGTGAPEPRPDGGSGDPDAAAFDAGSSRTDAGTVTSPVGCGCSLVGRTPGPAFAMLLAVAALSLRARRLRSH